MDANVLAVIMLAGILHGLSWLHGQRRLSASASAPSTRWV